MCRRRILLQRHAQARVWFPAIFLLYFLPFLSLKAKNRLLLFIFFPSTWSNKFQAGTTIFATVALHPQAISAGNERPWSSSSERNLAHVLHFHNHILRAGWWRGKEVIVIRNDVVIMSPLTSPHLTGSSSLSYSYHIPSSEFVVPIRMCWVKRIDFLMASVLYVMVVFILEIPLVFV